MSREGLELLVGMALVNCRFRVHLLRHPDETLSGFDLTPQEREMVLGIHEEIVEDFIAELWSAIVKKRW